MSCSVDNPEILGPIYDGDEVIIGATNILGSKLTLSYLNIHPTSVGGKENTYITTGVIETFDPNTVPRYKINFLSEDPGGSSNPYVFFTLTNAAQIMANCPKENSSKENSLTCKSGIGNIPNAGIGVTTYPNENVQGYPASTNPKASFLYPGPPAPIQLMAVDGTTPWFPLTSNPRQPKIGKYVVALSNVPYYMNAILEGEPMEKVNTIASLNGGETIECTPNSTTPSGCETQYYIIPTTFLESNSGRIKNTTEAALCKNCEPTAGPSAILSAFCSIGCNPKINAGQFWCSGKRNNIDQLDCTKVCKYGFTDKNDCNDNCFYDYCRGGRQCDGDCKSSCSKKTDICTLEKNEMYTCVPISLPGSTEEDPGTQPDDAGLTTTEIVGIAVVALFIVGLIIFVIYEWGTAYNKTT